MLKPNHEWKVLPQGTLTEIDTGIRAPKGATPMPFDPNPEALAVARYVEGNS
jgi:hypothetical protein